MSSGLVDGWDIHGAVVSLDKKNLLLMLYVCQGAAAGFVVDFLTIEFVIHAIIGISAGALKGERKDVHHHALGDILLPRRRRLRRL